jgi:hypothetical protein
VVDTLNNQLFGFSTGFVTFGIRPVITVPTSMISK